MAGCCTSGSTGNTGLPNGIKPFGDVVSVVLVPILANDGTLNKIDTTLPIGTQVLAGLNNKDASKRWYPYTGLDTFTEEEAEATTVTNKRGLNAVTRRGVRSVLFEKWDVNEQFYKKTKANCQEYGIYLVDVCGNLKGRKNGTSLYPMAVYRPSSHSIFMGATAETTSMVRYTFQYSDVDGANDDRWMLTKDELGIDMNSVRGLIDVSMTLAKLDATSMTVLATFDYGTAKTLIPYQGAVTADFTLKDDAGATVTVTAVEVGNGQYTLNMTAVPDEGTLSVYKAGTAVTSGFIGSQTFDFA